VTETFLASLPVLSFVMILLLGIGNAVFVTVIYRRSGTWTVPIQDQRLRELRVDVDRAHKKSEEVAREHAAHRRTQHEIDEALTAQIRKLSDAVTELPTLREYTREAEERTVKLDQELEVLRVGIEVIKNRLDTILKEPRPAA